MPHVPTVSEARELLKKYNKEEFHVYHGEIVSGVLGEIAKKECPQEVEYWQAVGMLHDIDYELYPQEHCVKSFEILKNEDIDEGVMYSVASHCYGISDLVKAEPLHIMEKYLFAVDELTGLIGAAARMRPSKSCQDMELKSVMKKFKTPAFAAGCSREVIAKGAQMLDISTEQLCEITLEAMKALGL